MIGIIIGSAMLNYAKGEKRTMNTKYGDVDVFKNKNAFFLQRHGNGIPPHKINHKANILALQELGVKKIISINSCGSMKKEIPPGSVVIPDDFINLDNITFFDDEMKWSIPKIDEKIRGKLIEIAKDFTNVFNKGVYFQTKGPRFETKAEINMFSKFADIVGMTLASEVILANELNIPYANISVVDNYANGIAVLDLEDMQNNQNRIASEILPKCIEAIMREL